MESFAVELLEQKQNKLFSAVGDDTFSGNRFKASIYDYIRASLTSSKDYATHFRFIWQICLGKTRKETIVSDILYKRNQYFFLTYNVMSQIELIKHNTAREGRGKEEGVGSVNKRVRIPQSLRRETSKFYCDTTKIFWHSILRW